MDGGFRYCTSTTSWFAFRGTHWEEDRGEVHVVGAAEQVAQYLFLLAEGLQGRLDVGPMPSKPRLSIPANKKPENYTAADEASMHQYEEQQAAYEAWEHAREPVERTLKWAESSNTVGAMKNTVLLARSRPGIPIEESMFDRDPYLLNVSNGTVELQTGEFREHRSGDLLTKVCPVRYNPKATCPTWDRVLAEWHPDLEVREFLQTVIGSAATGDAPQFVFLNVGGGANGKDTFFLAIQSILGSYAVTAADDLLTENRSSAHYEDLAQLRGARMVLFPETGAGDTLKESFLKNLTGAGQRSVRQHHGKATNYVPTYTVFLHTNHLPRVSGISEGTWRRIVPIMWGTTIEAARRDPHLMNKLLAESEGILLWIIEGALRYREAGGIRIPSQVDAERTRYRRSQDEIGRFVTERLVDALDSGGRITTPAFRHHYEDWCKQEGVKALSAQEVGPRLRDLGFSSKKSRVNGRSENVWIAPDHLHPHVALSSGLDVPNVPDISYSRTVREVPPVSAGGGHTTTSQCTDVTRTSGTSRATKVPQECWTSGTRDAAGGQVWIDGTHPANPSESGEPR